MLLSLVLLILNIFITIIALVLQQRYKTHPIKKEEKQPESGVNSQLSQSTDTSSSLNASGEMAIPCGRTTARTVPSLGTRVMPYGSWDMLPAPIGSLQGSEVRSESPKVRRKPRRIKGKKKSKKSADLQCADCTGEGCTSGMN